MDVRLVRPQCEFFYKYTNAQDPDRIQSIILEHQLYFPTASQLNDPMEAKPKLTSSSIEKTKAHIFQCYVRNNPGLSPEKHAAALIDIERMSNRLGLDGLLRELAESIHPKLEGYRIYSLSKRWNIMSLWASYGGNHTGVCLEFANSGPPFTSALEVTYDGKVELDITDPDQLDPTFFFHKSTDWQHEEEVRIFVLRDTDPRVQFDRMLLRRIILGKDVQADFRNQVLAWGRMREPNLLVVQADYDAYEQRLVLGAPQPASALHS